MTTQEKLIKVYKTFCNQLNNITHDYVKRCSFLNSEYKVDDLSKDMNTLTFDEEVTKLYLQLYKYFSNIDFKIFSKSELVQLGFQMWDDNLILAPSWVIDFCKDGTEFYTINNNKKTKGLDELDLDTRFGVTAFGFLISELRDKRLEDILE
jgi:hypothetical protein